MFILRTPVAGLVSTERTLNRVPGLKRTSLSFGNSDKLETSLPFEERITNSVLPGKAASIATDVLMKFGSVKVLPGWYLATASSDNLTPRDTVPVYGGSCFSPDVAHRMFSRAASCVTGNASLIAFVALPADLGRSCHHHPYR